MADNEMTVVNGNNFAANGANAVSHFFDTTSMEGKMALYNAMQTADKVDEHLNEPLHVTNVLAQAIEVANQETGEINSSTRVVIHAEEGDFAAASPTLALLATCSPFSARRTRGLRLSFLRWWRRRAAVAISSSTLNW